MQEHESQQKEKNNILEGEGQVRILIPKTVPLTPFNGLHNKNVSP